MSANPDPEAVFSAGSPPVFAKTEAEVNWRAWYLFVLAALAVEIIGFAFITNYFA
ncbi:hypothetical protein [Hymenobacter cavernae]|nr:hypothetical protein [Hymenobacter cavernae]